MADNEEFIVEFTAKVEQFAAQVRRAAAELNKVAAATAAVNAQGRKATPAQAAAYEAARKLRQERERERGILHSIVALEERRDRLARYAAAAQARGLAGRAAVLRQGLGATEAALLLAASARGEPPRLGPAQDGGRAGGRAGGRGAAEMLGVGGLTGRFGAVAGATAMFRGIQALADMALSSHPAFQKAADAMNEVFEWSERTKQNMAAVGIGRAGFGAAAANFAASSISRTVVEPFRALLDYTAMVFGRIGIGGVAQDVRSMLFPPPGRTEEEATARAMEKRREDELIQIAFTERDKEIKRVRSTMDMASAALEGGPGARSGMFVTAGAQFWSQNLIAVNRQMLREMESISRATRDTVAAIRDASEEGL